MSDDRHYVPGDWYRICDRTGFKIRAGHTRKEWTNRIVRDQSWEPRNAQDFVRGVADEQFVPDPRPRQTDTFLGPLTTVTTTAAIPGQVMIDVQTTVRMDLGDRVEIMMDNGVQFVSTILDLPTSRRLQLSTPLSWYAASGAEVVDTTAQTSADIG